MRSFVLKTLVLVWLVPIAGTPAWAVPITYSLNPFPGAPSFTGTITTDGTLGQLAPSNITAWQYTNAGLQTFSGTSADVILYGAVTATPTDITIGTSTISSLKLFHAPNGLTDDELSYFGNTQSSVSHVDIQQRGLVIDISNRFTRTTEVVSFAIASVVVPEPSSMALAGIGVTALLASARRRRRSG